MAPERKPVDVSGLFTPTGLITAVRAAAMSESQLRAVLAHPVLTPGGRKIVKAELRSRRGRA